MNDIVVGPTRWTATDLVGRLESAAVSRGRGQFLLLAPTGGGKSVILQQLAVAIAATEALVPIPIDAADLARKLEQRIVRRAC